MCRSSAGADDDFNPRRSSTARNVKNRRSEFTKSGASSAGINDLRGHHSSRYSSSIAAGPRGKIAVAVAPLPVEQCFGEERLGVAEQRPRRKSFHQLSFRFEKLGLVVRGEVHAHTPKASPWRLRETVPVHVVGGWSARRGFEVGASRVGDREQPGLHPAPVGYAQYVGDLPLFDQGDGGPCRPEPA